ncbi:MAG TPA: ABC transporter ATP-binding protein [Bellilinea sp.]|nr:ABC transporter ATP-binding protein [Bellilinea sp.]
MIKTDNLTKRFLVDKKKREIVAVENLTLDIRQGEVFGFLGPNGAGKTTTLRMLTALIAPTSGTAEIDGHKLGHEDTEIRRSVGILTESPGLYERLSAEVNLRFFACLYDVPDADKQVEKYLKMLGLWSRRMDEAGSFSKGMRQKLAIARALIHEPKVLFLDEPTSALDPEAAKLVRDFISELKSEGRTIFLCTHNLEEADKLCDRIGIFKSRLIRVDSPENLRRDLYGRKVVFHLREVDPAWAAAVGQLPGVQTAEVNGNRLVVAMPDPEEINPIVIRRLVELGADIQFVGELRYSLEEVYMQLIHEAEKAVSHEA